MQFDKVPAKYPENFDAYLELRERYGIGDFKGINHNQQLAIIALILVNYMTTKYQLK